jgi:putative thioredoxin
VNDEAPPTIFDVTAVDFAEKVIRQSHERPVVLEFGAEWCGLCIQLTMRLKVILQERPGAFVLAKIDSDVEEQLKQEWAVEGIPATKIFRNGKVVHEFLGCREVQELRQILDGACEKIS